MERAASRSHSGSLMRSFTFSQVSGRTWEQPSRAEAVIAAKVRDNSLCSGQWAKRRAGRWKAISSIVVGAGWEGQLGQGNAHTPIRAESENRKQKQNTFSARVGTTRPTTRRAFFRADHRGLHVDGDTHLGAGSGAKSTQRTNVRKRASTTILTPLTS
jgi:hypothetical protein